MIKVYSAKRDLIKVKSWRKMTDLLGTIVNRKSQN